MPANLRLALAMDDGFWLSLRAAAGRFGQHLAADPWGCAFWGMVWLCGFVATFLFLRMVFTRWGDRNITRKTLGLSMVVHALVGMVSTHVILVTSAPVTGEQSIPIRRVVAETPRDGEEPTQRQPRPAWDELASPAQARLDRTHKPQSDAPDPPVQRPEYEDASLPLPLPEELKPAEQPAPAPDVAAAPPVRRSVPDLAEQPSNEETAQARPEALARVPERTAARPFEPSREPIDRAPRDNDPPAGPVQRSGSQPALSPAPAVDVSLPAPARRSAAGDPSWRKSTVGPEESAARAAAAVATPATGQAEASPNRKPARAALDQRGATSAATIDRVRDDNADDAQPAATRRGSFSPELADRAESIEAAPRVARNEAARPLGQIPSKVPSPYSLRGRGLRGRAAREHGATEESEQAVRAALEWLARKQHPDGYWPPIEATQGEDPEPLNFGGDPASRAQQAAERRASGLAAESGLTALAVLAFLGAGHTHQEGPYGETVDRALRWLIARQESNGYLGGRANRFARMYCHGMAAIALGEAYGMTKDPALREPLARAVEYVLTMQYPDGSWRYTDYRQLKEAEGDMSMFGWQLMALKSAQTAGLRVPVDAFDKAIGFLSGRRADMRTRRESAHGGLAAYRRGQRPKPAMTAEALYCSQLLGMTRNDPAALEAVEYLAGQPPRMSAPDLYYWYYGTLAMYHHGGESWRRWNQALQQALVEDQRDDGDYAGSWNPRRPWGDFGGRVFSTATSALCLEVYYRYLPLYQAAAEPEATSPR